MGSLFGKKNKRGFALIKVNLKSGQTLSFNLGNKEDYSSLSDRLDDDVFARSITGISVLYNTYWHAITVPQNFKTITYHVERVVCVKHGIEVNVGERIVCHADDIRLTTLVYYNEKPKITRIDMKKVGKPRYIPKGKNNVISRK